MKKSTRFRLLALMAVFLSCLTFTPLVIPCDRFRPTLFHLPYTLWTGIIVSALFVLLTYLAFRTTQKDGEAES